MALGGNTIWIAAALGVAGIAVLRFAWSLPRRSPAWNGASWALLAGGAVLAARAEGAWGVSVAALAAMGAAFAALAAAGIGAPQGRATASNRRVGMLPEHGEPRRIGRRIGTFLLTIVAGLAVSVGLGLAVRGLGGWLGWSEANSNVLALYTVPVAWAVLVFVLLMQTRRKIQVLTLVAWCVPALPVLVSGALR